jgi:hypothetical protein
MTLPVVLVVEKDPREASEIAGTLSALKEYSIKVVASYEDLLVALYDLRPEGVHSPVNWR